MGFQEKLEDHLAKHLNGYCFTYRYIKDRPGKIVTVLEAKDENDQITRFSFDRLYDDHVLGADMRTITSRVRNLIWERGPLPNGGKTLCDLYVRLNSVLLDPMMLEDIPHRKVGDMALTYHIRRDKNDYLYRPSTITNELLRGLQMSRNELDELALKICRAKYPAEVLPLSDTIRNNFKRECEEVPAWYISDREGITGAAAILYDGVLEKLSRKLRDEMVIIPSSIHEMIVLPKNKVDLPGLEELLKSQNKAHQMVRSKEVLSDHLYSYDREGRTIQILSRKEERNDGICEMERHVGGRKGKLPARAKDEDR